MKKTIFILTALFMTMSMNAGDRVKVWPKGKMPHSQEHQFTLGDATMKSQGRASQ